MEEAEFVHVSRLAPPPPHIPKPILDLPTVLGRRVVVGEINGRTKLPRYRRGLYAASEVYWDDEDVRQYVNVATAHDWFRWVLDDSATRSPFCPRTWAWPAHLVWTND